MIDYLVRLTTVVDVIRLLLEQGLAFVDMMSLEHSMQRGDSLVIMKWYCGNNQLTSRKIKK